MIGFSRQFSLITSGRVSQMASQVREFGSERKNKRPYSSTYSAFLNLCRKEARHE